MKRRGKKRGLLVSFEGGEAAGKSTQIRLLARYLKSQRVPHAVTRQPGGTKLGVKIRRLLLDPALAPVNARAELLLYEADRAQHVEEFVRPALARGKIVISDRFADSSTVYQGICRGLGKEWTLRLNDFATAGLSPDLVFVIDLSDKARRERLKGRNHLDRIEREKEAFHRQVRAGFLWLSKRYPRRFRVLDGSKTPKQLAGEIATAVQRRLG